MDGCSDGPAAEEAVVAEAVEAADAEAARPSRHSTPLSPVMDPANMGFSPAPVRHSLPELQMQFLFMRTNVTDCN